MSRRDSNATNRNFYELLWSQTYVQRPERFNTWPLISGLLPDAPVRLEIGPGLRPRLPIAGTHFLDISRRAIDVLTSRGGIAVAGEVAAVPFGNETFDLVSAFDVIEHTGDDAQVFGELARVLKEGGVLVFSVPLHCRLWTRFDEFVGHVRRYEPSALQALISTNGLVLEKSAVYGMQPSSPLLLDFGLWWLKHNHKVAMWWYNILLMPLGMLFQKRLKLESGLVDTTRADEIILVCRKCSAASLAGKGANGGRSTPETGGCRNDGI